MMTIRSNAVLLAKDISRLITPTISRLENFWGLAFSFQLPWTFASALAIFIIHYLWLWTNFILTVWISPLLAPAAFIIKIMRLRALSRNIHRTDAFACRPYYNFGV